jgi:hypothetical protein
MKAMFFPGDWLTENCCGSVSGIVNHSDGGSPGFDPTAWLRKKNNKSGPQQIVNIINDESDL